jgi:cytochrome c
MRRWEPCVHPFTKVPRNDPLTRYRTRPDRVPWFGENVRRSHAIEQPGTAPGSQAISFFTPANCRLGAQPLLFCRETARYYHRLFPATYSLRTPTVKHMTKLRTIGAIGLGFCAALLVVTIAAAQMPLPAAKPPDGTTLFKQQCATCHTTNLSDPTRQGPSLFKIVGKPAGKADGFRYSTGFAEANFVWDDARLDAYLANPQAMVPGSNMAYRQPKAETRTAIIAYLKELN